MRVLFLENHDSFSGNVIDRLPCPPGDVTVRDGGEAGRDPGALDGFDAVVLGLGPTDPVRAGLVGLVRDADRRHLPLLLVNAVAGPCRVAQPGRPPVPEEAIARIRALFASLTVR